MDRSLGQGLRSLATSGIDIPGARRSIVHAGGHHCDRRAKRRMRLRRCRRLRLKRSSTTTESRSPARVPKQWIRFGPRCRRHSKRSIRRLPAGGEPTAFKVWSARARPGSGNSTTTATWTATGRLSSSITISRPDKRRRLLSRKSPTVGLPIRSERTTSAYQFRAPWISKSSRPGNNAPPAKPRELASALAELYVGSIATLSPTGDIVFTLGDLAENGSRWSQLVSVLPLLGHLPVAAIVLKVGKRKVRIRKHFARLLEHLTEAERKSILTEVGTATSDKEAAEIVRRRVARLVDERQIHHAISDEVYNALEEHKRLKGKYRLRDERFETLAKDFESHHGYQGWHRDLDLQVAEWIKRHRSADEATFEKWLRWRYREPDLSKRFPSGLK